MHLMELMPLTPLLTAGVAIPASFLAGLNYRRERNKTKPIVEAQVLWSPRGFPTMPVVVRNLNNAMLTITKVEILKPAGSKIGIDAHGLMGLTPFPAPQFRAVSVNYVVFPPVTSQAEFSGSLSNVSVPVYFEPPRGWDHGWVKARIALASAAGKGKPRWFNVERRLDKKPEWLESWFFSLIEERENQNQHAPQIVRRPDLVGRPSGFDA